MTPPAEHPYFRIISEKFGGHGRKINSKASTAFVVGVLVSFEVGAGTVYPMQAGEQVLGICKQAKGSADATTLRLEIEFIIAGAEVLCPVSSGTPALTEQGDELDVVTGGLSVTMTESNKDFRTVAYEGDTSYLIATCIRGVYCGTHTA